MTRLNALPPGASARVLELRGSAQDTAGKDGPMVKEKTARMKTEGGKWVITDITGR